MKFHWYFDSYPEAEYKITEIVKLYDIWLVEQIREYEYPDMYNGSGDSLYHKGVEFITHVEVCDRGFELTFSLVEHGIR